MEAAEGGGKEDTASASEKEPLSPTSETGIAAMSVSDAK
jgi:hypothetical protein